MELHLVHHKAAYKDLKEAAGKTEKDALAVLGIFFKIQDEDNEKLKPLIFTGGAVKRTRNGIRKT